MNLAPFKWINVGLRAVMELGIVLGLGYSGYHSGTTALSKILLAIAYPVIGFGVWSLLDFHRTGQGAEYYRLTEEILISGLTAWLVFRAGKPQLGIALALISIVHHLLIYLLGDRLLKK